jgi:hypothetical protein
MSMSIYFCTDNNSNNYWTCNNWYVSYEGNKKEWIALDIGTPIQLLSDIQIQSQNMVGRKGSRSELNVIQ